MPFILLLAVLGGLAFRLTSPDDRARYLARAKGALLRLRVAAADPGPEYELFHTALGVRTRHTFVAPAIVALNVAVFGGMLFGTGALSDPNTLVAWGGNLGARTTNGEWWRLLTSSFLHLGVLHLLVDAAVLIQLGSVLERLVGRPAFAAVYLSAGVFAGLVNISAHPVDVTVGVSGAIFGLYGLLLAVLAWQVLERRDADSESGVDPYAEPAVDQRAAARVTIPLVSMIKLAIGGAVFILYSALGGFASAAELAGLAGGIGYGLVLARGVSDREPEANQVGAIFAAACAIAITCALPLRNIADVKPEITGVLATEERTVLVFQTAHQAFKTGRMTAEGLARIAERTIVAQLQAADRRLEVLRNVPVENRPIVTDAREYLRLRTQSWRARAEAIRSANIDPTASANGAADAHSRLRAEARFRSNLAAMGNAETAERASLEAFARIAQPR